MDGRPLFSHTDGDDERVEVFRAPNAGHLHIVGTHDGSYLPRAEVLSLIQALTEWAYPTHTPERPNRSLIEELIAKAVKDQVAAVLPLHLSPAAEHRPEEGPEADPEPGDVGHPRPPLPLRGKTVIIPECGLCKRPWNDGHGQPGDPCPGVEEARQHPGDWTDALWRVKPVPAGELSDEKTYCGACGHSWVSHWESAGGCTSAIGKGTCECVRRPR